MPEQNHAIVYRAGVDGFGCALPDREPHWKCTCGGWTFPAKAIPNRTTGNNHIEAVRAHAAHAAREMGRPDETTGGGEPS